MTLTLTQRIQTFYDESSQLWEQVWGEHMHHGYYGPDGQSSVSSPQQAQITLIEELLIWAKVTQPTQILDVGCGIGGSSLFLAEKYKANVTGITLSPVQADRAIARAQASGLDTQTQFQVADALAMPFPDNSFDLVWSLESGEHMPDKAQFLAECCRVLKPGGTLMLATWCHRVCEPPKGALSTSEKLKLEDIYKLYHLPYVISIADYEAIAQALPFENIQTADWSKAVAPFWDHVIQSALNPQVIWGILTAGWQTIQGTFALRLMSAGYQSGLVRYGLLSATKQSNGDNPINA